MLGGAAGLALGLAATPIVGPLAVAGALAAGAYTGSLAGAVGTMGNSEMRSETSAESQRDAQAAPLVRPAGVVVAVHTPTTFDRDRVTAILERYDANSIEHAEGTWKDGTWGDFDPVSIPKWQKPPERPH